MAHLTGKAVEAQMGLPIGEEATAKATMTDRHHDKILHTVGTAIGLLSQSGDMGVIGHCHSQSHPIAQQGR